MVLCKLYLVLALLGLSVYGGSAQLLDHPHESAFAAASTTKASAVCTSQTGTAAEAPRHSGICYISEIKTTKLSAAITSLTETMNADGEHQHHQKNESRIKTSEGDLEGLRKICSSSRIIQISEALGEVGSQLWSLANRVRNIAGTEVGQLEVKKSDLIQRLKEIRVFSGFLLTSKPIVLQSFEAQVELLEANFNSALTMFLSPRPSRSPIKFKPWRPLASSPSSKSVLTMYAGSLNNFNATLEFIRGKSSLEEQILGYVALYQEMSKHSHLDTFELTTLAAQVQRAENQPTSTVSDETRSKLTQLTHDIAPVIKFFRGNSTCKIINVALSLDLGTAGSVPEYGILLNSGTSYPRTIQPWNSGPLVRIYNSGGSPFYSLESLVYDSSRRRMITRGSWRTEEQQGFMEWKLVPVNGGQHFRILNAHYSEVLFADPDPLGRHAVASSYRRVFLKRHDYSGSVDMLPNGDLWNLNCT